MKKLLFVLAFTFIGQEVYSQMHIVTIAQGSVGGLIVWLLLYNGHSLQLPQQE